MDEAVRAELGRLELGAKAAAKASDVEQPDTITTLDEQRSTLGLHIKAEERRLDRLEDLLLDETLDAAAFARKKRTICVRLAELREELTKLPDPAALTTHQEQLAELQKSLVLLYDVANRAEKRMIVENVWPNRTVSGKEPLFEPYSWVKRVDFSPILLSGAHERNTDRTFMTDEHELTGPLLNLMTFKSGTDQDHSDKVAS